MLISSNSCELLKSRINSRKEIFCRSLFLSARWFVVSQCASEETNLIILPNQEAAEYCCGDLYNLVEKENVFFLPKSGSSIERSNYKSTLNVQRTSAIEKIIEAKGKTFIVTYPEALEDPVPDIKKIKESSLKLQKGQTISHEQIIEILGTENFERVDFVSSPGQYAIRGSLLDVFSYADNQAYRISFWGNEIEKISSFDCNTQLSKEELDKVDIVSDALCAEGENNCSILDLLPPGTLLWLDSSDMYHTRDFYEGLLKFKRVYLDVPLGTKEEDPIPFKISPQPVFNKNFELLVSDVREKMEHNFKVYIFAQKQSQLDRLKTILFKENCPLPEFIPDFNIHAGFIDSEDGICCYSDHEIFDRFHRVSIRGSVEKTEQLTLNDLSAFNVGDYVVHIDHGVGIFGGLVRQRDDKGRIREVVRLTYKDGDVVFVSVHALNKISRFRSKDGLPPKINKLGSKTWVALKAGAKAKVKDIAKELIQLYAKRRASEGFAFSPDTYLQTELESSFMYEDTPDQEEATKAVKRDMEDKCPMDRLVCGDVGFGKTEIAIRAAFKAVTDGKQVGVLVPTTILALQHYKTFSARLENFPCTVEYVSRLRTAAETAEIRKKLAEGRIDILIGTHKVLGKGFEFKDLGLLIVDEEQKFGVSAKEKLRELKANVDTLTLTATPIPRTLQFSLLGARDLSIISTPPANRIPVQTEIILFDENEIRSIIEYELNRNGQIFFLHNKVEELPSIEDILHRLVPDMRICVAHGQMEPKLLENKMLDFIAGEYDMLLCTTIIENGLDIPNANTIIINQAQNIGLSDLHQLRGRVGRSNRKAFCYLIVPPLVSIGEDARRRLKAIEEFSDLGSGFNIAMQDLDIRGAGNLLGAEQSGFITEMGFETYQKILSEAMEELGLEANDTTAAARSQRGGAITDTTIETDQPAHIPDDYLDITPEKMRIYKRLDSVNSDKEADRYAREIEDRFGKMPEELVNLFNIVKIRNLASRLGFEKVIIKNGMFICFFVLNPMSTYYKSETFASILEKIQLGKTGFEMKQSEGKLKIITRNINTTAAALEALKKLQ